MFKKLLKLFLAVALVFTLFACTTTNQGDNGKTNEPFDFNVPFEKLESEWHFDLDPN